MLPFLSFPTELRLKIYGFYLQSTIIRIPGPPVPNTLALLSACRTIHQEASPEIISTATFSLWSTRDLICFLGSLSDDNLRALRHIAVCVTPYNFEGTAHGNLSSAFSTFADALSYFPGLQLDTLTVRDGFWGYQFQEVTLSVYWEIEQLILKGNGWKELRFFSPNMSMFKTKELEIEQPKDWDKALQRRDGKGSGASVHFLVGKDLAPYTPFGDEEIRTGGEYFWFRDSTTSPPLWDRIDEHAPWREENYMGYDPKIVPLTANMYDPRPLVVIARRGNAADHVEGRGIPQDFRLFLEKYSWKEIKEKNLIQGSVYSDSMPEMKRLSRDHYNVYAALSPDSPWFRSL